MSASEHDIRVLTDAAAKGDGNPVCDFLKPLVGLEERYAVLHAITDQNKNDRKNDSAIPELDLYFQTSGGIKMMLATPGQALYSETAQIVKSNDRSWYLAPDLLLPRTVICTQREKQ